MRSDRLRDSYAALASLPHLDTACFGIMDEYLEFRQPALPGGLWLGRLRCLVMPATILAQAASLEALSEARLERLGVSGTAWNQLLLSMCPPKAFRRWTYRDAEVQRILDWAQQHPSLQLLVLQYMSPAMRTAAAAAQQRRPELRVAQDKDADLAVCGRCMFADA